MSLAPSVPRNFDLSPVTDAPRSLRADWVEPETPNGMIQNYTITCNNSNTFTVGGQLITFVLVGNFEPFMVYECSVFASTNGGVGNASEPAVARTEQDGERKW